MAIQPSELASHSTQVVCVNVIHEWRDLQPKVDSDRQIFEKLFMAICLYTIRVSARNLRINIFYISFWCLTYGLNRGLTSNKPTHTIFNREHIYIIKISNYRWSVRFTEEALFNSHIYLHTYYWWVGIFKSMLWVTRWSS